MSSILTNSGAMTALQTLRTLNTNLTNVQQNVATGKQVGSAKDNASVWSIAQVMDSDVKGFKSVNESLAFADSAVNIARIGAETVVDLLKEVKVKLASAVDGTADQTTIQADIDELVNQVTETVAASQFNGQNYLQVASPTAGFLASLNRVTDNTAGTSVVTPGYIVVADQSAAVTAVTTAIGAYDATASATTDLADIEDQIADMAAVAAAFGQGAARIEIQREFNMKVSDAFKSGISAIADTDMEEASARLQALQVQQQLGVQSLSIANQQSQSILSLFR